MISLDKQVLLDLHGQLSKVFGGDPAAHAPEKLLDGAALATVEKSQSRERRLWRPAPRPWPIV